MYGEENKLRYVIGFAAVIILLFLIIFLIVRSGGGDKKNKVEETKKTLTSYAADSNVTVSAKIIGPVTAAQDHHEIEIDVTNALASVNVINGYNGNVVNSKSYPMSNESFSEFLSAIDKAGFTKGDTDKALKDDTGYCASGQRYIFEIRDATKNIQRFWTTSCGGTKTYKGERSTTLNLFENQIPDYGDITDDVSLGSNGLIL